MASSDDDRIAYLAGEPGRSLSPEERAELDELNSLLGDPATWAQPDAGLEERVVAAIAQEAGTQPARARARRPAFGLRLRSRRPVYALAGVAAGVIAAILVAGALNTSTTRSQQFAMVVSGTSLLPRAHGAATLTKRPSGWRIELSVAGLPHLANGSYYQAWLKNPAGVLVPVGTFNDARQVTLWSGVPVTTFRTLSVTRQRANGNPASSGERVLLGTIRAKR